MGLNDWINNKREEKREKELAENAVKYTNMVPKETHSYMENDDIPEINYPYTDEYGCKYRIAEDGFRYYIDDSTMRYHLDRVNMERYKDVANYAKRTNGNLLTFANLTEEENAFCLTIYDYLLIENGLFAKNINMVYEALTNIINLRDGLIANIQNTFNKGYYFEDKYLRYLMRDTFTEVPEFYEALDIPSAKKTRMLFSFFSKEEKEHFINLNNYNKTHFPHHKCITRDPYRSDPKFDEVKLKKAQDLWLKKKEESEQDVNEQTMRVEKVKAELATCKEDAINEENQRHSKVINIIENKYDISDKKQKKFKKDALKQEDEKHKYNLKHVPIERYKNNSQNLKKEEEYLKNIQKEHNKKYNKPIDKVISIKEIIKERDEYNRIIDKAEPEIYSEYCNENRDFVDYSLRNNNKTTHIIDRNIGLGGPQHFFTEDFNRKEFFGNKKLSSLDSTENYESHTNEYEVAKAGNPCFTDRQYFRINNDDLLKIYALEHSLLPKERYKETSKEMLKIIKTNDKNINAFEMAIYHSDWTKIYRYKELLDMLVKFQETGLDDFTKRNEVNSDIAKELNVGFIDNKLKYSFDNLKFEKIALSHALNFFRAKDANEIYREGVGNMQAIANNGYGGYYGANADSIIKDTFNNENFRYQQKKRQQAATFSDYLTRTENLKLPDVLNNFEFDLSDYICKYDDYMDEWSGLDT